MLIEDMLAKMKISNTKETINTCFYNPTNLKDLSHDILPSLSEENKKLLKIKKQENKK